MHDNLIKSARQDGISRFGVWTIISDDKKVLLVRRRKDDFLGGIYEFPGGTLEVGEGLTEALSREIKEETGLTISKVGRYLGFFDYDSEKGERTRVFTFESEVKRPLTIKLKEHDRFVWANPTELNRLDLSEPVLDALRLFRSEGRQEH
jgi:8-oxo-dGTP diphosphatase